MPVLWDTVAGRGLSWVEPLLPLLVLAASWQGPVAKLWLTAAAHSPPPPGMLPFLLCSPLMLLWFLVNATLGERGAFIVRNAAHACPLTLSLPVPLHTLPAGA